MILFHSKKSKAQAKKQKVAKKPGGEEGADPYDFESEEEEQDTGGKLKNNVNGDFLSSLVFLLPFFPVFVLVDLPILIEKKPYVSRWGGGGGVIPINFG